MRSSTACWVTSRNPRRPKEPLNNSHVERVDEKFGEMRMNASVGKFWTTKVVVHTTSRGDRRSRRRIWRQPEGTGLAGALALSLGSPIAPCYWLRLASRHHPRQAYPSRPRGSCSEVP